jgi:hypothetical protein
MVTIVEGLTAVTTGLNVVKTLRDIDRSVQEADFKLQIATVTTSLADAKLALVEAQEEIKSKDAELEKLRSSVRFRAEETIESNGFVFRKVDGKPVGRAHCPVCLDEGRFLNLNSLDKKGGGHSYQCPKCKADFGWNVMQYSEPSSQ